MDISLLDKIKDIFWEPAISWLKRKLLQPEQMKHDRIIFQKADEIFNERDLTDYLEETASLHSYRACFLSKAEKLIRFLEQTGNQFLDKEIMIKANSFINRLSKLTNFLSLMFSPASQTADIIDDNFRFIAHIKNRPNLGVGVPEYDEFVSNLERHIRGVDTDYRQYR